MLMIFFVFVSFVEIFMMESMVSVIYLIPNPEVKISTKDIIQAITLVKIFSDFNHRKILIKVILKKATQSGTKIFNGRILICIILNKNVIHKISTMILIYVPGFFNNFFIRSNTKKLRHSYLDLRL